MVEKRTTRYKSASILYLPGGSTLYTGGFYFMFFDIARITANNGWAMAVTGALLVMLGLATLSLIISQLHKIIGFFEKETVTPDKADSDKRPLPVAADVDYLADPEAAANLYKALSADLGDPFDLAQLYRLAQKDKLPHPHYT
jgi:hypothetical protein